MAWVILSFAGLLEVPWALLLKQSEGFTRPELAVLQRVAWGYSNSEIANQLSMAVTTVAEHKAHAMRKLDLNTRIDVVRYAEAQGWKREQSGGT